MTAVLAVEVTTNVTQINPQHTNTLKMTKKRSTKSEASKEEMKEESHYFFRK